MDLQDKIMSSNLFVAKIISVLRYPGILKNNFFNILFTMEDVKNLNQI